ncbi:lysophospholipid acyltransferase 7 [Leguminivora glycinivorella]|uniref:lysophospholipid acyltransferase 7 n=1 Tax=Leguminivora glycinivorella TaxID=1035111 RepID=UPI00200BCE8B|nr:lysophospholipid acyltransferase 7 [Leguminivora glycinivorella]
MLEKASNALFFTSLLSCVPLGRLYRTIEDDNKRRVFGTGIGILTALLICGRNVFYTGLMVLGNIVVIRYSDKRYVHKISLFFTWMFLLHLYFNVGCTKYSGWLFQTMALRLVGLAFEIYIFDQIPSKPEPKNAPKVPTTDERITQLTAADIVMYAYFFIGIHKGPYYTWRTFNDHLNSTVSLQGDFWEVTQQKLRKTMLLTIGYIALRSHYPLSTYEDDDFYTNYGSDYRFLFSMSQLMIYYLESQIILMITTSACSEAGFGVYPAKSMAIPGAGSTRVVPGPELPPDKEEYNFAMLKCFDNEKILMGPRMKDTIHGWDMATRYWFAQYIVKNLINNNFEVRSACSFLFWTIWVGGTMQDMIMALTLWVYIHLESDYSQLYAETLTTPWNLGFAIMRILCLCYLTPCILIDDWAVVLRYYKSIYWAYHIVLGVLTVAAIAIDKNRARVRLLTTIPKEPEAPKETPASQPKAESPGDPASRKPEGTSQQDDAPSTSGKKTGDITAPM